MFEHQQHPKDATHLKNISPQRFPPLPHRRSQEETIHVSSASPTISCQHCDAFALRLAES